METELREMLRDRADRLTPPVDLPPPTLRRARRRRWTSSMVAATTAAAVVVGSVIGIQAVLGGRTVPIVQPTTPTGPPPYGSVDLAIWPTVDGPGRAALAASVAAGKDQWVTDPSAAAIRFAKDVMGWDSSDVRVHTSADLLAGTAEVTLRNPGTNPEAAETISLARIGGTQIWLVTHASTELLEVTSPLENQAVVEPNAPVEVAGSVTQPPSNWTLTTVMEYAGSLLQGSEAQTRNDLALNGPGFDVTLIPNAAYLDGPTLSLRIVDAGGTTLGMYARRFATASGPSPSPQASASVYPAIWPEGTEQEVATEQKSVDQGQDQWRLDPEQTARRFAEGFMGWSAADVSAKVQAVPGPANDVISVDLWNAQATSEAAVAADDPSFATELTLRQLARTGPGGIWSVTQARSPLIDLQCPGDGVTGVEGGGPMQICGQLGWTPAEGHVSAALQPGGPVTLPLRPCNQWPSVDIGIDFPSFDGILGPVPTCSADTGILTVRLVNPLDLTVAMDTLKLEVLPPTSPTPTPTPTATSSADLTTGVFGVMLTTIHAASPPHWTYDLTPGRLDRDWTLDGTVDDGSGPGRLMIDVTDQPGKLEAHPCSDPEFTQGAPCVEEQGVGGSLLVLRDVLDQNGNRTIEVVLVRPDRSGIGAEAGNWIISGASGNSGGGSNEQVTRADPVYSVDQLGNLVQAVAEKVYPCIQAGC